MSFNWKINVKQFLILLGHLFRFMTIKLFSQDIGYKEQASRNLYVIHDVLFWNRCSIQWIQPIGKAVNIVFCVVEFFLFSHRAHSPVHFT